VNTDGTSLRGAAAIREAFARAQGAGRAALITYLTFGYPTPADSLDLVPALEVGGADIIELGVPFSDPVADGPAIQRASHDALQAGVTPAMCLELAGRLRKAGVTTPFVFMGYYNPIYDYGLERYADACRAAGVDGLIVPDLPLEEAGDLGAACQRVGLALIQLVAPNSPPARAAQIAAATEGFLYVVSRMGTTGAGASPTGELGGRLAELRQVSEAPVSVGFGISRPDQARALAGLVDGIIVGSAVVERAAAGADALREYVSSLRDGLSSVQTR
jgi:tryptophan synthase alpha chain